MKNIIFLILLITQSVFANETDNVDQSKGTLLKAQIIDVIKINETRVIKAQFVDLKEKAIEMGVNDIYIDGSIQYIPKGNYQQLDISWGSLANQQGLSKTNYSELSESFSSQLTTDNEQILPPQELIIEVNEDVLMSALKALSEKNQADEKITLDESTISSLQPDSTSVDTSEQASSLPSADWDAQEESAVSVEEVACTIRYSIEDLKAYEQISINTIDASGETVSVGACLDSGVSYELEKVYGYPCTPLVSEDMVYQSYRITGIVAGDDEIVRGCQVDLVDNLIEVQTTTDQCSYEHHLDLGLSYETERKFYELNSEVVTISNCETNQTPYQHSEAVCSYDIEISPGFAVPQVRTYITQSDGSEFLVQECTTRSNQIAIYEQECTDSERYYHDFNASTSYLQKEKWVKNPFDNDNAVKVNDCQISSTTYAHLQKADDCTPVYEDHNLRSVQSYKPYIVDETQSPSEILLSETCSNSTQISYVQGETTFLMDQAMKQTAYTRPDQSIYQELETTVTKIYSELGLFEWIVPNNINKVYLDLTGGDGALGSWGGGDVSFASVVAEGDPDGPGMTDWPAPELAEHKTTYYDVIPGATIKVLIENKQAYPDYGTFNSIPGNVIIKY